MATVEKDDQGKRTSRHGIRPIHFGAYLGRAREGSRVEGGVAVVVLRRGNRHTGVGRPRILREGGERRDDYGSRYREQQSGEGLSHTGMPICVE